MTSSNTRDEILDTFDRVLAGVDDDVGEYDKLLGLIDAANSDLEEDERAYLKGYALYLHPRSREDEQLRRESERELMKALESSHDTSLQARSALYLGHLRYDQGRYGEALVRFEQAKAKGGELSDYLKLKAHEMALCSELREHGLHDALGCLAEFVDLAEALPIQDVWPRELAAALSDKGTFRQSSSIDSELLLGLAQRLDRAGRFGTWFTDIVVS